MAVAVVAGLLASGGRAWAAGVRYAGAQGSGAACTRVAPCAIGDALAASGTGEAVVLLSGEGPYGAPGTPLAAALVVPEGVAVEGAPDEARPVVNSAAATGFQLGSDAALIGVNLDYTGPGAALEAEGGSNVSRALIGSTASVPSCELGGDATVANTVCSGEIAMRATAATATDTVSLRNDTLVGNQRGLEAVAGSGATETVAVHNSIVRGGGLDVLAERAGSGVVSVQLGHSNFATVEALAGTVITAPGSGENQTAAPHFVDAAGTNFEELGDSPTIDAGEIDLADGEVDLPGNPRVSPGHLTCDPPPPAVTDIGAYELQPIAPPCYPGRFDTAWIPTREARTRVPRVRGLTLRGAVTRLHRRGLRVTVGGWRPRCRSGAGPRRVTSQRPGARALVPPGSRVLLLTECGSH